MEIMERLTEALAYIEENLMNEINYTEVAKRAYCSSDGFKRVFSIIAGISPAEYVRRRRMTLAALELKDSNCKISDIALKYGYESPGSFTRAFSSIHGLTPSDVRKSKVSLTVFPRLFFKIHIKGANEMNYRIEKWRNLMSLVERVLSQIKMVPILLLIPESCGKNSTKTVDMKKY